MTFRVANVISAFNSQSGGPPRTVSLIAAAGSERWSADLFTTDYIESSSDTLIIDEFPGKVHLLPSTLRSSRGGFSMLLGLSRQYQSQVLSGPGPDVFHLHGMWSPYLAAYARTARRSRIPYIVAPHGMLEPWSLLVRPVRKSFALRTYQGLVLKHASALHATSRLEADNLRRLNASAAPIYVIPNPISEPAYPPTFKPAASGKRILLFLSRLHEKKGLDMLLQVWGELRPAGWSLQIAGSGTDEYVQRLKRYCSTHHVPDVEFSGHVEHEQREQAFRSASAFVLPTFSENFGNVVAEALIRGLPVLTTTGTPWSDLVPRRCGWYIEPTLPDLRRTLAEVTRTDSAALRAMGERGREYARSHFTVPVVRDALLEMYSAAMRSRADG